MSALRYAAITLSISLTACAGRVDYVPPSVTNRPSASRVIDNSRDAVWAKLVPALSKQYFVINTIDKQSGLINISYSGNPELYIDCGQVTSYVKNARGERTYSFPGAVAQQTYEIINNGQLVFINRKLELEGRVNVVVEEIGPRQTRITASTRYVVTKRLDLSNPQGQSATRNDTISFNSGGDSTFPGAAPATTCRANGKLESEITGLAG